MQSLPRVADLLLHVTVYLQLRTKQLVKLLFGAENARQDEVQQGPQLAEVVLQRRAGQQQAAPGVVHAVQHIEQQRVLVLQPVRFVHLCVLWFDERDEKGNKCLQSSETVCRHVPYNGSLQDVHKILTIRYSQPTVAFALPNRANKCSSLSASS